MNCVLQKSFYFKYIYPIAKFHSSLLFKCNFYWILLALTTFVNIMHIFIFSTCLSFSYTLLANNLAYVYWIIIIFKNVNLKLHNLFIIIKPNFTTFYIIFYIFSRWALCRIFFCCIWDSFGKNYLICVLNLFFI
jgi:hypothetical protein